MSAMDRTLIVKGKAGMGNRMLCALTGILLGKMMDRRVMIDWRDVTYSSDGSNTFGEFFAPPNADIDGKIPTEGPIVPAVWEDNMDRSMSEMLHTFDPDKHSSPTVHKKYSIDPARLEYDEPTAVFWYYTDRVDALRSHFAKKMPEYAGLDRFGILRKGLAEEMPLREHITKRIDDLQRDHFHERMIGMHVRFSDRQTSPEKAIAGVRAFKKRDPEAGILLATDSKEINEQLQSEFDGVVSIPKWYPEGNASMHQNPDCENKIENGIEALVDMYLLARCDYLVYPGASTFSMISRVISGLEPDRVIDTERYRIDRHVKAWIRQRLA